MSRYKELVADQTLVMKSPSEGTEFPEWLADSLKCEDEMRCLEVAYGHEERVKNIRDSKYIVVGVGLMRDSAAMNDPASEAAETVRYVREKNKDAKIVVVTIAAHMGQLTVDSPLAKAVVEDEKLCVLALAVTTEAFQADYSNRYSPGVPPDDVLDQLLPVLNLPRNPDLDAAGGEQS
jgi:hypothetical protein